MVKIKNNYNRRVNNFNNYNNDWYFYLVIYWLFYYGLVWNRKSRGLLWK